MGKAVASYTVSDILCTGLVHVVIAKGIKFMPCGDTMMIRRVVEATLPWGPCCEISYITEPVQERRLIPGRY